MGTLGQDLRFSLRILARRPGFTLVVVLTLALGIGANTAVFSVVHAVILRPLPFEQPDRLITLWENHPQQGQDQLSVSYPNFLDWREQSRSFEHLAAYRLTGLILKLGEEPTRMAAAFVTADLFTVLRVTPSLGRTFLPAEDQPGGDRVVIVSHGFWQRRFGGDPHLVGQTISILNAKDPRYTVVGIMPPGFQFPEEQVEAWLPLGSLANQNQMKNRAVHLNWVLARLKPGVTLPQARTEMETLASRIQQQSAATDPGHGVKLVPLHEQMVGQIQPALVVLLGAVLFVLLIACANVANLLLARATARQTEIAIRTALGASRFRIIRQLLAESLCLAVLGGAAGLLLALWGVGPLTAYLPDFVPRAQEIRIDGPVLGFTLIVSLLTGVGFGLVPAIQASKPNLSEALKAGGGKSPGSFSRHRVRGALVISEVALSLVLLIGAGLLIKSFWRLMNVDPGFQSGHLLTMSVGLPGAKYREEQQVISFFEQLPRRLEALPGVQTVSAVSSLPISGGDSNGQLTIEGRPFQPGEAPGASYRRILPNYFRTMGIPLRRGREFDERDRGEGQMVVIINDSLARRFWPHDDPIGKRLKVGPAEREPWLTIIGVVGDVRNIGLEAEPNLATYEPHAQRPWSVMDLVVRTKTEPLGLAATVRGELRAAEKDLVLLNLLTMDQRISVSVAPRRFNLLVLGIFAAVALVLAAIGIYGVMSYAVTQRTHEIGIRLALGAESRDVLKLVIGRGMTLALAGVAMGLVAAYGLTRLMRGLLFEVSATDPATFGLIAGLLMMVALAACYLPARRATQVDPMVALRYE